MTRKRLYVAIAGLLLVGGPAISFVASAQDLEFEQVGDLSLDASDLAFGGDGALWASAAELWLLEAQSTMWEEVTTLDNEHVLVLSSDTLLIGQPLGVRRSIDRGLTWNVVHTEGGGALFEAPSDGLNRGLVLASEESRGTGIAYSTNRGASFTSATFTVPTNWESTLNDAVEIPDGPAAGRIVAGVFNGIVVSEDGGRTWNPSSLFQEARFRADGIVISANHATGARRLFATLIDTQASGGQLYTSADDGLTWTYTSTLPWSFFLEAIPLPPDGDGTLLAVTAADGVVFQSEDSGSTWTEIGQVPFEFEARAGNDSEIGPDGRLYVSVGLAGPEREWVYRSTEPVVVATEPAPELPEPGEALRVHPNPAEGSITVRGVAAGEEVVLYDVLGRAVLRSGTPTDIDVSALPPGVYVLRAGGESRLVTVRRH